MRKQFADQRGSEKVYTMIGFSIIFIIAFFACKFGLPFLKNMTLSNYTQELVNFDYWNTKPNPSQVRTIHNKLINRIKEKNMPIPKSAVKVDYDQTKYQVQINYTYVINLWITEVDWEFIIDKQTQERD